MRRQIRGFQILHESQVAGTGRETGRVDKTESRVVGHSTFVKEQRECLGYAHVRYLFIYLAFGICSLMHSNRQPLTNWPPSLTDGVDMNGAYTVS